LARSTVETEAPEDVRAIAFTRLTGARLASCYRLATVILGDPAEAEDATHDAAVRAWERWGSLRHPGLFDAWFGRILVNECRDRLRRRRVRPLSVPLPDAFAGGGTVAGGTDADGIDADGIDAVAERHALARAVDELPPDQRIAVVLHFYLDLSSEQMAERTGARVGTVKSRLHYAVRALRAGRDAAARVEGGRR
jgi:RNA polymerase sigma factor (sigma-70 family)